MPAHTRHGQNQCQKMHAAVLAYAQIELLIGPETNALSIGIRERLRYNQVFAFRAVALKHCTKARLGRISVW